MLEKKKESMVAALVANGQMEKLSEKITELENSYDDAISFVRTGKAREEEKIDWDNPFLAPIKRSHDEMDKVLAKNSLLDEYPED